jgi:hypothetical protein
MQAEADDNYYLAYRINSINNSVTISKYSLNASASSTQASLVSGNFNRPTINMTEINA